MYLFFFLSVGLDHTRAWCCCSSFQFLFLFWKVAVASLSSTSYLVLVLCVTSFSQMVFQCCSASALTGAALVVFFPSSWNYTSVQARHQEVIGNFFFHICQKDDRFDQICAQTITQNSPMHTHPHECALSLSVIEGRLGLRIQAWILWAHPGNITHFPAHC